MALKEPDWSNSKTLLSECWKNPLHPMNDRLEMADGAMAYYYPKEKSVSYVDCSVNIVNMARKLNVTLLDRCEKDET